MKALSEVYLKAMAKMRTLQATEKKLKDTEERLKAFEKGRQEKRKATEKKLQEERSAFRQRLAEFHPNSLLLKEMTDEEEKDELRGM
jgi:hypothetical protein